MKNFRFTIGKKIGFGFGILIFFIIVINYQTAHTVDNSKEINDEMINVHSPSVDALQELKILVLESKVMITNWVFLEKAEDPEKQKLIKLTSEIYPEQKASINAISSNWNKTENEIKTKIFTDIDELFNEHETIKNQLATFEDYSDGVSKFLCEGMLEDVITPLTSQVLSELDELILKQRKNSETGSSRMLSSFNSLNLIVKGLGFALTLGGILIAIFTVRSIVRPVQNLKAVLLLLGKGIIPKEKLEPRTDEIGDMSIALNDLVDGFQRTAQFAKEVGSGNFESEYQPLSKDDNLGHSLLAMRTDLNELTSNLEQKVIERTEKIEEQKQEIEILLKHTTDSIVYAKRIQEAILPPLGYIREVLPNSFFLYRPKDIVSGDFYWVDQKEDKVIFAAIDCTGHGVPGAFMTIIGHNGLSKAINYVEDANPAAVLDALNKEVSETFKQHNQESSIKDGMDAAMCTIDFKTRELQFAGAYNPLFLIRDNDVIEIKGNKFPIGEFLGEEKQSFTNNVVQLNEGETIYIFSDGYADQFGGPKGKKFMFKRFRELLLSIQEKSMDEQRSILNREIDIWRGDLEQVDDIIVIGLRV